MSPAVAEVDEKAGWSTQCRAGNFETCETLKYRCKNPRHHSEGETPAQRSERLLAEARERAGGAPVKTKQAPPPKALPAPAATAKPTTDGGPRASSVRRSVLDALARADGRMSDASGRATGTLLAASGYGGGMGPFSTLLQKMEQDGLVERETRGTRTYAIEITDAGRALVFEDDGAVPAAPAPATTADKVELTPAPTAGLDRDRAPKLRLVWSDPPQASTTAHSDLVQVLTAAGVIEALRTCPGEWMRLVTEDASLEVYCRHVGGRA